jgi:V/A-type H+/Na+-transporting ATPase subunit E
MKALETGKDKIQRICDALRHETLTPAKQEAAELVENAHLQAAQIMREAQEQAQQLLTQADQEVDQKRKAFQSALQLAARQGIEHLKQKIEQQLLFQELSEMVIAQLSDPKWIAELINSFMASLEEKGIEEDLLILIPRTIPSRAINGLLVRQFLDRLEKQTVSVGDFSGGVQIKLRDRKITIDISDSAVKELIASYIRSDFRELVFQA